MIDWAKFRIAFDHSPIAGEGILFTSLDGEVTRSILIPQRVRGSHDSSISVRSHGGTGQGGATHLEFCGNPSKFLQGHNVVGVDDLCLLVSLTVERVFQQLGFDFESVRSLCESGQFQVTWIDINYSFSLSCQTDVLAWIRAAEFKARTRNGRPVLKGSTVYFQKHSRRWAIKAYSKYQELNSSKEHRLPLELENSGLMEWSQNILRVELRLLGKELRGLGLMSGHQFTSEKIRQLFNLYLGKIIMCDNYRIPQRQALELPPSIRSTYVLWQEGHYIPEMVPKATFYRHRKYLLQFGIDISIPNDRDTPSNVVPLIRVLEATPAEIPAFAYEKGLIAGYLRSA